MKSKLFALIGLGTILAALPVGLAPTRADYYWPNDATRNSYYAYNPGGGTPYFFSPYGNGRYASNDGQNNLVLAANQVSINTPSGVVLNIYLTGANTGAAPTAFNQIYNPYPYNSAAYWQWKANGNQTYANVQYNNVYPGTDLTYYNDAANGYRRLGYDFTVAPGYDPRVLTMDMRDAQSVAVDNQGNLIIIMANGQVIQKNLRAYQNYNGQLQSVPANYNILGDRSVGFNFGNYDTTRPLYVDPVMNYSPYDGTATSFQYQNYSDRNYTNASYYNGNYNDYYNGYYN